MGAFVTTGARPSVVHAGDILLSDVTAHRVQVFKFELLRGNVHDVHSGRRPVEELTAVFAIADFGHCSDLIEVALIPLYLFRIYRQSPSSTSIAERKPACECDVR